MAIVLLLRHGRTQANADGVLAGWSEVPLDPTGVEQAKSVAERLRDVPLKAVLSSPVWRCRQTAEHVTAAHPDLTVTTDDRLGECRYGDWEGKPLERLATEGLWRVVQQRPSAAVFPGPDGEPLATTAARAVAAVRETDARISAEYGPEATWLACSHGDVIKAVTADALGLHLDMFQRIVIDPCSITVIRYTPIRPFLMRLNDTGGGMSDLIGRVRSADAAVGGGPGPPDGHDGAATDGHGGAAIPAHHDDAVMPAPGVAEATTDV